MRTFVAVSVPPAVADVLAELERPVVEGLRWTTPEQWHVTLRFLGEVLDPGPIREALAPVPRLLAPGAAAEPGGAGGDGGVPVEAVLGPVTAWFPGRRVLHVPVRGLDELAAAVRGALDGALTDVPAPTAARADVVAQPFVGHLTLARMRGRRPGPARLAGVPVSAEWPVESFSLMGSTLGPGGSRYDTAATFSLHA